MVIPSPRSKSSSIALTVSSFTILLLISSVLLYSDPLASSIQSYFQQLKNPSQGILNSKTSSSCDLYKGRWFFDPRGPLYANSCRVIAEGQNCRRNGRPDKDYENWRWKPHGCELPRFDVKKFLNMTRNKTIAFVGDSLARNQMQSLLCILLKEESRVKNRGYHAGTLRVKRWYFSSTSTIIARIWSSWLVHTTIEPLSFAPEGMVKVHLDIPDKNLMEFLPSIDIAVVSSGHWFTKRSAYVLNSTIVGGQLWWPKEAGKMKVNNVDAFGISVETILSSIASHPNFTGSVIVRSYSPSHYEGGAWNTGGTCTGEVRPASKAAIEGYTRIMHDKQAMAFHNVMERLRGGVGTKFIYMDTTDMFGYRRDGHPGPYRSLHPNTMTKGGPKEKPPPQDCLHWCMPGAVDTWNEILAEIIRRDYGKSS